MDAFTIFPAIDLRHGQVVRLRQGDPRRQTVYDTQPRRTAQRWLEAGTHWLHVVNLDASFGESAEANWEAVQAIQEEAAAATARVQLGGGLRSWEAIQAAFAAGISRLVLGTAAVEDPGLLQQVLASYGAERVAAAVDARDGRVRVRGWSGDSGISPESLAQRCQERGLRWLIYTDISRDGQGGGPDLNTAASLMRQSGLQMVASGGVYRLEDVLRCRRAGLAGVIIGRALYEGQVDLCAALAVEGEAGGGDPC